MAYTAHTRPAAVYSAMAGLVGLSVCGLLGGMRLYMPHHHTAPVTMADIGPLTPAPAPPKPTTVAFETDDQPAKAAPTRRTRARPEADDTTLAAASIGDRADTAALAPTDGPTTDDADGPVAEQPAAPPPRPDDRPPPDAPLAPDESR